jgi:hypothetical protein
MQLLVVYFFPSYGRDIHSVKQKGSEILNSKTALKEGDLF